MKQLSISEIITAAAHPNRTLSSLSHRTRLYYLNSLKATNVFSREWDVLVILDACRMDLLESVAAEYDFLTDSSSIYSVASQSEEWMDATFSTLSDGRTAGSVVVTGNPFSDSTLQSVELQALDEVWTYAWDDEIGTVPARPITDRAITHGRESEFDRLVVHYMQPHFPSVPKPRLSSGPEIDEFGDQAVSIWSRFEEGTLSREDVWDAGQRNLRYVLDEVELLLQNIDAETVCITADHGDAYGEQDVYGHPRDAVIEEVRKVPWVETTGSDNRTHSPDEYDLDSQDIERENQLEALGYL